MKYHISQSKRGFMKTPVSEGDTDGGSPGSSQYRDLDEVKASPAAERKLPWWIKEVDKPTVEIDWGQMKRFDSSNIMFVNGFSQAVGPDNAMKLGGQAIEAGTKSILENEPGYTLREKALVAGGWLTSLLTTEHSFLGPGLMVPFDMSGIPNDLDYPRYEGTPEENTRMVRAAAKLWSRLRWRGRTRRKYP